MIIEVLKALIGVGKFPDKEFEPTLFNVLAFGLMLMFLFLFTVGCVAFIASLFIT